MAVKVAVVRWTILRIAQYLIIVNNYMCIILCT